MSRRQRKNTPRNPYHDHPLMKRGEVHGKTNKARRAKDKRALQREWRYPETDSGPFSSNAARNEQGVSEGNWFTSRV